MLLLCIFLMFAFIRDIMLTFAYLHLVHSSLCMRLFESVGCNMSCVMISWDDDVNYWVNCF